MKLLLKVELTSAEIDRALISKALEKRFNHRLSQADEEKYLLFKIMYIDKAPEAVIVEVFDEDTVGPLDVTSHAT